jgi:hypothetical protein
LVPSAIIPGLVWKSLVDNNTSDPDTGGANWAPAWRVMLTANTNFYVNSSTGLDTNNGLTTGTAWQTLQGSYNNLQNLYDLAGYSATVNLAASTSYSAGLQAGGPVTGITSYRSVTFTGPSSVSISVANNPCFESFGGGIFAIGGGMALSTTGTGGTPAPVVSLTGGLIFVNGVSIGSVAAPLIGSIFANSGGAIILNGTNTITGGSQAALKASGGLISANTGSQITLSGSPAFSGATVLSTDNGNIQIETLTWSGGVSGGTVNYSAIRGGGIDTNANLTAIPGSGGSATAPGWVY